MTAALHMVGARPRPAALAFLAKASSTGSTIAIPANAQAGDLAVLIDQCGHSSGTPSDVIPTGWTGLFGGTGGVGVRGRVSGRILTGTGTITGMSGTFSMNKFLLVFRASSPIVGVNWGTWAGQVTNGDPSPQVIAAAARARPVIAMSLATRTGFTSQVPAFAALEINASGNMCCGYTLYDFASPVDHTVDLNASGVQTFSSGFAELTM